jgi:hypothetical protein
MSALADAKAMGWEYQPELENAAIIQMMKVLPAGGRKD